MRTYGFLPALALAASLVIGPASATDTPKPAVASEMETQRAEIKRLRERVAMLEVPCTDTSAQQPPPATGVPGGTPKYLLKRRWDQLETGMGMDEVRALLGRPSTSTHTAAGQVEIWGYGSSQANRYGVGTVYFDDDKEVTTWMSPIFKTD